MNPLDESRRSAGAAEEQRPARTLRLLVAEDNLANQKVAVAMLARMGLEADVVVNGAEAVEAFQGSRYAAILMDCHMPVMDGYDATAAIRALEQGRARTPVIAMTASVMGGEREKCLAAGMDDYLAKPVMLDDLRATLKRWIHGPDGTTARSATAPAAAVPRVEIFDPARVEQLRALGSPGKSDMFLNLATMFLNQAGASVAALGEALSDGDLQRARHEAHTLRGGAATVGARRLADLCSALEDGLVTGSLPRSDAVALISAELQRVRSAVDKEP